jgi:hypothetical protein
MPASTLKASVSSESDAVPDGHPVTERRPEISASGDTWIGSADTPTTTSLPSTPRPPTAALIDFASVTVARTTLAPPSFISSAATSCVVLSM